MPEPPAVSTTTHIGPAFIEQSRAYLGSEYLPKIRRAVHAMAEADLWWRPNAHANSVGNLLLHLAGNLRQWVVSGIGGEPDARARETEFAADGGRSRRELLELLETAVHDADRVLAALDAERLLERRVIQGREVSLLQALYHATEHFGMHTGQIIYIAKLRAGVDLGFYAVEDGVARQRW